MRIPVITLAATLCLNGAVSAAPAGAPAKPALPNWQTTEESWSAWVSVEFVDAAGKGHALRCHWTECGQRAKPGTARLYEWKQDGAQMPFEYRDPKTGRTNQAWKSKYTTKLSHYTLKVDKGQWAVVDPASGKTFPAHSTPDMTALGSVVIVFAPTAMAADAPGAAKPDQQAGAGKHPAGKKPKPGKQPATAPIGKFLPLSDREKAWLSDAERSFYEVGVKDGNPTEADKAQVAAQYREVLGKTGLPEEFRTGYAELAKAPDAAKIDAYLLTLVEITGDQLAALEKIVKGKEPAGYKLTKDNARQDYDEEMKPLAKDAGHPAAAESRKAYAITAKYRAMLKASGSTAQPNPNPDPNNPGGTTTAPTRLSDKELATLTSDEKKAYEAELAAAGKDAAKIAEVNKKYRAIAGKRDLEVFNSLGPDEKADLCKPFKAGVAQGSAADSRNATELGGTGNAQAQLKQTAANLTGSAATSAPQPPNGTAGFSEAVRKACFEFLAGATKPTGPIAGPTVPPSPGMKAGSDKNPTPEKKGFFDSMDKETAANVKAGVAGAFVGILVGSFFGPGGMILGALIGGGLFFGANYAANKMP